MDAVIEGGVQAQEDELEGWEESAVDRRSGWKCFGKALGAWTRMSARVDRTEEMRRIQLDCICLGREW